MKTHRAAAAGNLKREIGLVGFTALIVNCMIGAGILGLPGKAFALTGPTIFVALGVAAILALAVAFCLARLAARYDRTGGPILYIGDAFGPLSGFLTGWLLWLGTVLSAAALLNLVATFSIAFLPGDPQTRLFIIGGVSVLLTVATLSGIRESALASTVLTAGKLLLIVAIAIIGLFIVRSAPAITPNVRPDIAGATVLLFYAFIGFERPTALAGEVKNPRRTLPIGLVVGVTLVCALYLAIFAACVRAVPNLAGNPQPIASLVASAFGASGNAILTVGALVTMGGTLFTQWMTAPRLLFAMAQTGDLPGILGKLDRRQTPYVAILATAVTAAIVASAGSFTGALAAASAARLLIFAGCALVLLKEFANWKKNILPLAVLAASCALLAIGARGQLEQLGVTLLVGGIAWWILRMMRAVKPKTD